MFRIKLVDIGGDGLVATCGSDFDTLAEVEALVTQSINEHLGIATTRLEHIEDLVYAVIVNGRDIGAVVITSL